MLTWVGLTCRYSVSRHNIQTVQTDRLSVGTGPKIKKTGFLSIGSTLGHLI